MICGNAAHRLGRWSRPAPEPAPTLAVTMPRRLRRLLATFLLLALAFQSVWAAAAPYCRHEVQRPGAASVFHIGHHSHVHHAAAGPLKAVDGQPTSPSSPATESGLVPSGDVGHASGAYTLDGPGSMGDGDCSSCQGACAALLLPPPDLPASQSLAEQSGSPAPHLPAPPAVQPERPNWA